MKNQLNLYCAESEEILEGIDFSEYGGHRGDWQSEQFVLWSIEEDKGTRK